MESTKINLSRLQSKSKWVYSAHSQTSQRIEQSIAQSRFDVKLFGDLVLEIADGLHGVRHYVETGVVMLAVGNVTEYGLDLSDRKMVTVEEHERLKRSQVQKGDLLITITGRLGTALIYDSSEPANLSAHVARAKINSDLANPEYICAYFNTFIGKQQIEEFSIGSLYPHINVNRLQNVRVILPPTNIQDRIAQIMQVAYEQRSQILAKIEQLYRGIDQYILNVLGINIENMHKIRSSIQHISHVAGGRFDFEAIVTLRSLNDTLKNTTYLREVCTQINERIHPAQEIPHANINYVSLGNIAPNIGELVHFTQTLGSDILSSSPRFQKGDILFGRMRPYLNKVWIAEFDGICSGEAIVLRPDNDRVDVHVLHALLLSRLTLNQIIPLQSGTALPRVSAADVLNIKLPIPSEWHKQVELGQEIVRRRAEARRLRTEAEQVVTAARARVERMMLGEEEAL